MATFPSTVFQGSRASDWNMKLVPGVIPVTGWSPTWTRPALGRSSPATRVSVVDLPQPVGPDDGTELSRSHRHVDVAQGGEGGAGRRQEALGDPGQLDPVRPPGAGRPEPGARPRRLTGRGPLW